MNQKKKWVERHGRIVRNRRSRWNRDWCTFPHWERNLFNRQLRRHDDALLRHGRWDDFHDRLMHDAPRLW